MSTLWNCSEYLSVYSIVCVGVASDVNIVWIIPPNMEYKQYMESAMESIYGKEHVDLSGVEAELKHLKGRNPDSVPHNFYMAHLKLVGRIVESEDKKDKYNYVSAYGHLLDKLFGFMKDQGFEFHGIRQFDNRSRDTPEMTVSFTMHND